MKPQEKIKRKLSDIDFSSESAHIALCHKDQGVANLADFALVLKASTFSDEVLQKLSTIQVTLELPAFLERFFSLEEEDAAILATLLGYVEPVETVQMEQEEANMKVQEWISENTEGFQILKSLNEAQNLSDVLSKLSPDEYVTMLKSQQRIEKGLKKLDQQKQEKLEKAEQERKKPRVKKAAKQEQNESPKVDNSTVEVTPNSLGEDVGVVNPVVKLTKKENTMTKPEKVTIVETTTDVEMVEKSTFEAIQKQFQEQQEQLQKALASVAKFEQEKQEQIAKARKAQVLDAVKDEAKAEVLFKAVGKAEDTDFEAVVKALKELASAVDNSDLFVEKGATVEVQDAKQDDVLTKLIKAKFSK